MQWTCHVLGIYEEIGEILRNYTMSTDNENEEKD